MAVAVMDGARVLATLTSIGGTNGMCTTTLSGAPMYETPSTRLKNGPAR
jgi:hypothetical protein